MGRIADVIERITDLQAKLDSLSQVALSADGLPTEFADLLFQQSARPASSVIATGLEDLFSAEALTGAGDGDTWPAGSARTFDAIISEAAARWDLPPALVHAVVRAESDYNPRSLSPVGAMGLMQLMPETARDLGVTDPWNPVENLNGGCRYLRAQLDRFGRLDLALAAYNAGPGAVNRYGGIPPYRETRTYVKRVVGYLQELGGAAADAVMAGTSPWETKQTQPVSGVRAQAAKPPDTGTGEEGESRRQAVDPLALAPQQRSDQALSDGPPPSTEGQAYALAPIAAPALPLTEGPHGETHGEAEPAPAGRSADLADEGRSVPSRPVTPTEVAPGKAPGVPKAPRLAWRDEPSRAATQILLREDTPVRGGSGLQPLAATAGDAESLPHAAHAEGVFVTDVAQPVTVPATQRAAGAGAPPEGEDVPGAVLTALSPLARTAETLASTSVEGGDPAADRVSLAAADWAATGAADPDRAPSAPRSAEPTAAHPAADGAAIEIARANAPDTSWAGSAAPGPGHSQGLMERPGTHESAQTAAQVAQTASQSAAGGPSQAPQRLVVHVESSGGPVSITAEGHQDRVAAHLSVGDWHDAQYLRSQEPALRLTLQSERVTLGSFDVTDDWAGPGASGGHRGADGGNGSGSQAWAEQASSGLAGGGQVGSETQPSGRAAAQTPPGGRPRGAQAGHRLLDLMA